MAEISEPPERAKPDLPESTFLDPETMRTTKPGLKRLFVTFSVLLSFLLGLPFLWKSVEIYRSPLPFRDIDDLSAQIGLHPLRFPFHFGAIFVGFKNPDPLYLRLSILRKITKLTPDPRIITTCTINDNFTLSVSTDLDSVIAGLDLADNDAVDEALKSTLRGGSGSGVRVYTVVVVNGDGERAVVGKYRHAWIVGRDLEAAAARAAEVFVKVFGNGGREEGMVHTEFMPVGADGRIVLSFNLLNADPRDWVFDWYENF